MVNRFKGEVPFLAAGKGAFVRFDLEDLADLEETFGRDFFSVVEEAAMYASPKDLPKCLAIGLKRREKDGTVVKIWDEINTPDLLEKGFKIGDAGKPILEAIAQSHLGKSYDDLVQEALDARKKNAAEAVKQAKEAADEAGVPFEASEALLNAVLRLQTGSESAPSTSGD